MYCGVCRNQRLVQLSRKLAGRRPVLFHGTRYPKSIARSGMLLFATAGDPVVCFSRSVEVAAYWADMPRDDDEGRGAVFVFDRCSLATRYRLEPFHDPIGIPPLSGTTRWKSASG